MNRIPTANLKSEHLPEASPENWREIEAFALTYDGYKQAGGFNECAATARRLYDFFDTNGGLPDDVPLPDLRSALSAALPSPCGRETFTRRVSLH